MWNRKREVWPPDYLKGHIVSTQYTSNYNSSSEEVQEQMPEKYFLLEAGEKSRMEEVLCSVQQHGFKEIVTLVKDNDNIDFEH